MSIARKTWTLIAVAILVITGVLAWQNFTHRGTEFDALFESSVGLYPGSNVEVLVVPVGTVTRVRAEGPNVRVSMRLDSDRQVAADSAAVIVAPTLVSDRF